MAKMSLEKRIFTGIGVGGKKVVGKLRFLDNQIPNIQKTKKVKRSKAEEKKRLKDAVLKTVEKTKETSRRARETLGESEAQIFEIHAMLLEDEDFLESAFNEIENGKDAESAVLISADIYAEEIRSIGDEYLSARAADIKDICNGIIDTLSGENEKISDNEEPYILVAQDLTPSQTVKLDKEKILGFVTFEGSPSSHTSILARAMGIPAIVGTGELPLMVENKTALLDGVKGKLVVSPTKGELNSFLEELESQSKIAKEHDSYMRSRLNTPAVSRGGHRVMIYANIGDIYELDGAILNGAEGIGLLRSEFMYITNNKLPTEDELYEAYKEVAIKMEGKRVIIRTLDIGADKKVSYLDFEKEENPALGFRGIRVCLERTDIFKAQLRAILRASAHGKIGIMLPMISTQGELKKAIELINDAKNELRDKNILFDEKIELGIMIETPSAAIISDCLARYVSFFSVGTNDLCQYTLAADRQNAKVSHLQEEQESVLRLIKLSAENIHRVGGWIGICGEMAADLSLTQAFVDMEIDELSVSPPYLLGVRGKVCDCR